MATQMSGDDLYGLYLEKGLSLEDACIKYPFLVKVLKEHNGVDVVLPDPESVQVTPEKPEQMAKQIESEHSTGPGGMSSIDNLVELIRSGAGKFDINLNINLNFKIGG